MYFPVLAKYNPKNSEKYASLILILINEFETRFQDFRKNSQLFAIFATPFSVDIPAVETKFQMECIELQSDIQLKEKFNMSSILDFYKLYLPKETYPVLHDHALFMFSLFGSTYICEQLFSRMKNTKNENQLLADIVTFTRINNSRQTRFKNNDRPVSNSTLIKPAVTSQSSPESFSKQLIVKSSNAKPLSNKTKNRCYNCVSLDHISPSCTQPKRLQGSCFKCGASEHKITHCP
ncbi:hypothetical protein AGLY_011503 [Aphis glycines]|uniref:CCHC-type domain-containing protein n=1 Tax=Aphis glycines TaxID=307491 RepID=A0A6G0TBP7_APHGL|nr:hypothetical protein AGLY_011503 [Aphis glycines]